MNIKMGLAQAAGSFISPLKYSVNFDKFPYNFEYDNSAINKIY